MDKASAYAKAWGPYVWPISPLDDIKVAPFHLLASEGAVHFERDYSWHMAMARRLVKTGVPSLAPTAIRQVSLTDDATIADAIGWWEELVSSGG